MTELRRRPDTDFTDRPYKKGMRIGGVVRTYADGSRVYITQRRQRDIYCSYTRFISDAMRNASARWAVDVHALYAMRALGIEFIAIDVTDTGDVWACRMSKFFDMGPDRAWKRHDHQSRDGAEQRDLPLAEFTRLRGTPTFVLGA